MKTVFDAKQWILECLLPAKTTINGGIYKDRRPTGSTKEDIVINDIVMDNSFYQDGVFNVNCYVPMLNVTIGNVSQLQPDHARMRAIANAVYALMHDVWKDQYNLTVVNHKTYEEQSEKATYINFRINLKTYN